MSLEKSNNRSDFFRRLKFYILGFLLGLIMINFLFKDRSVCKMPGTVKLEELRKQKREYTPVAECQMKCIGIDEGTIQELLKQGKVNYSKSETHASPCPTYAVEGERSPTQETRILVADCDTISRIFSVIDLSGGKDTCDCK